MDASLYVVADAAGLDLGESLELCRRIREGAASGGILALTDRSAPEDIEALLEAGADDFATFPCEPGLLRARLGQLKRVRAARAELKLAEQRLLLSERMASVGTLAAGVAHEINNPLAFMVMNLDFAAAELNAAVDRASIGGGASSADSCQDPAACAAAGGGVATRSLREAAEAIHRSLEGADRVRHVVQDLTMFSRVDDDNVGVTDLREVLKACIQMTRNELRHRAQVVEELGVGLPVRASKARLGQVFLNLLMNAAQAIPAGAADRNEVRVTARSVEGGRALIEICDTGQGIPEEVLPRIFEPFFTTKPVGEGTGLGLSICHGIVSRLGGEIQVETRPGEGSVLRVLLPIAEVAEEAPRAKAEVAAVPRRRLLVIDDEVMLGEAMRRMLRDEHDVDLETSARVALRRLCAGERYDGIFCDLMMPEMTGMEFYEELSQRLPGESERVIFITGGAFTAPAREFLQGVRNLWLTKPFGKGLLQETLKRLLEGRR
jgi:signal transduction histidine kinase